MATKLAKNKILKDLIEDTMIYGRRVFKDNWKEGIYYNEGSKSYENWKPRKKDYPHPILRDTEDALKSIKGVIHSTTIEWVVTQDYMTYHHNENDKWEKGYRRPILYDDPKIFENMDMLIDSIMHQHFKGHKPVTGK